MILPCFVNMNCIAIYTSSPKKKNSLMELQVVSGDGKRVKRLNPLRFNESRDHKVFT